MKYRINQIDSVPFGTSGIRGLVSDMTDQVCYIYTIGFLQFIKHKCGCVPARVAIATDLRASSPRIALAVGKAIEDSGSQIVDCGQVPTPVLTLYGIDHKIPCVMITGSHIPEDRNGLKFGLPSGEILKHDENEIRKEEVEIPDEYFLPNGSFRHDVVLTNVTSEKSKSLDIYRNRFCDAFPSSMFEGIRVGLYEHSAVGRDLLFDFYSSLGMEVTRLGRCDEFISVDTEAVPAELMQQAQEWANPTEPRFDAIVSTDGDSDRPLVFDERGQWIRGDKLGILCAHFMKADCVVAPLSASSALERSQWFPQVVRTKIGSPYVVEAMNEAIRFGKRRIVGFESNGGFLTATSIMLDEKARGFLSPLPTRDAAIVHLAILAMAKTMGIPLSKLVDLLPYSVALSDRIKDYPSSLSHEILEKLVSGGRTTIETTFGFLGNLTTYDTIDGLRMTFGENDIVHLRPSGNAPEFRCYTEANTSKRAEQLLRETMNIVESWRKSF